MQNKNQDYPIKPTSCAPLDYLSYLDSQITYLALYKKENGIIDHAQAVKKPRQVGDQKLHRITKKIRKLDDAQQKIKEKKKRINSDPV